MQRVIQQQKDLLQQWQLHYRIFSIEDSIILL